MRERTEDESVSYTITVDFVDGNKDGEGAIGWVMTRIGEMIEEGYTSGIDPTWNIVENTEE